MRYKRAAKITSKPKNYFSEGKNTSKVVGALRPQKPVMKRAL